jgi:branched-chain amino acid aminotransferase/4-amino-4-deoxychorismate lyase
MRVYVLTNEGFNPLAESNSNLNRGYLYGDGFFETIAVRGGGMEFWAIHKARMYKTAEMLQISMPSEQALRSDLRSILAHLDAEKNYRLRITCHRSGKGKYAPITHAGAVVLQVEEVPFLRTQSEAMSWKLAAQPWFYNPYDQFKLIGKHQQVLLSLEALQAGVDELLIWNQDQNLVSCIAGNVLLLINNVWYTPALSSGALNGTVRQVLLQTGCVQERVINVKELDQVQCMVRTNSISGLQLLSGAKTLAAYHEIVNDFEKQAINSIQDFLENQP